MPQDPHRHPDPLKRHVPPEAVPLRSPMPRSRVLDAEEPELNTHESDVAPQARPEGGTRDRATRGR
ncbi:MAG: hypothetical protein KF891_02445 [Rhizobacter sp.]|nr:hypothetical protein [Rhizobacter sp.]